MDNQSKHGIFSSLLIVLALLVGIVVGLIISYNNTQARLLHLAEQMNAPASKIDMALSLIDRYYVDSVATDSLVEQLLPDLMWYLDPHSVYIPASELNALNEPLDGEFDGIGVMFNMATDTIVVLNVIPQGPSQKAGIQNGDRIIRINDSLVAGQQLPIDSVMKMLRGKRGTKVQLAVQRQHAPDLLPITVTRGKVPVRSVDAACMLTPDVGFLRITNFSQHTHDEMMTALNGLRKRGMTKLILDLRGNSGGYFGQAILMANEFLPTDRLIVYTEDRDGNRMEEYSDGRGHYQDVALAVLIDEQSASSSEIFAGALQDNDRATIVGRRSFGKGLVQNQIEFTDGSMIRLTIARYYTPSGRCIQKPYTAGDNADYEEDLLARYQHGEFFSQDSIKHTGPAYHTGLGRTVYGGGGITPDIFVPEDTLGMTSYFKEAAMRGLILQFAFVYTDNNRPKLSSFENMYDLADYLDSQNTVDKFATYADKNGLKRRNLLIKKSYDMLKLYINSRIIYNIMDEEDWIEYLNLDDNVVKTALDVFKRNEAFPKRPVKKAKKQAHGSHH